LVPLLVFLQEEQAYHAELEEVESSKQLIDRFREDETVGFGLSVTNVDHLVPVSEPEEAECDQHHDQDQGCDDGIDETCGLLARVMNTSV
jgi:hypothetical protein